MTGPDGWSDFELAVGSTHGVRAFTVDSLGRLEAIYKDYVWSPGENVAKCEAGFKHTAPHPNCNCGFYAFYTDKNDHEANGHVVGVIEGYGKTVVGSKGFRCQKAKIVGLYVPGYVKPKAAPASKPKKPRPKLTWRYGRLYKREGASFAAWMGHSVAATVGLCMGIVNAVAGNTSLSVAFFAFMALNAALAASTLIETSDPNSGRSLYTSALADRDRQIAEHLRHRLELVQRNYAGIRLFETRDELVKAFPLKNSFAEMKPTPETDPDFWKRQVK